MPKNVKEPHHRISEDSEIPILEYWNYGKEKWRV